MAFEVIFYNDQGEEIGNTNISGGLNIEDASDPSKLAWELEGRIPEGTGEIRIHTDNEETRSIIYGRRERIIQALKDNGADPRIFPEMNQEDNNRTFMLTLGNNEIFEIV